MKKAAVVVGVMVLALALSQSAMAAPTQGYAMAGQHTNSDNLLSRFLGIFGAIWGGKPGDGAIWGNPGAGGRNGAIWGGRNTGSTDGAIWGGKPGDGAIWGGKNAGSTDGAIWGCKTC